MKSRAFLIPGLILLLIPLFGVARAAEEEEKKDKDKKPVIVTEEIVVTAAEPQDFALSSTSIVRLAKLEPLLSRNLAEVMSFTSGTYVSNGSKAESRIKIRGLDNDKSTLLFDGIPIYDPYFNSYDLKTILTEDVQAVKVVKGSSSVLYGPNTLGGIVEVLTRRPNPPSLSLRAGASGDSTALLSASGSLGLKKAVFLGSVVRDQSDGQRVKTGGESSLLPNSDYEKTVLTGKFYLYPGEKSEILAEASYYTSEYGIAWATEYYSPRYWRFKEWRRLTLGLGGTFPFLSGGTLKARTYYTKLDNTLDSYKNSAMSVLDWESIYKNYSAGAFLLGSHPLGSRSELRFSLNSRIDHVEQQGSATSPWEKYEHQTFSAGLEDDLRLTDRWRVTAGVSLDHLKKQSDKGKTSLNPMAGVKFRATPDLDFHLTLSQKSRFPSMRSLYSVSGGNPNLKDEMGRTLEAGAAYRGIFNGSLAFFTTQVEDLIYVIRMMDGTKSYTNIGKARSTGFETELGRRFGPLDIQVNYTFLDTLNKDENRPLELTPKSQLNLIADFLKSGNYRVTFWALAASRSEIMINKKLIGVPGYTVANISLEKYFGAFAFYLKLENLFDAEYVTDPGYPMPSRRLEAGLRVRVMPEKP